MICHFMCKCLQIPANLIVALEIDLRIPHGTSIIICTINQWNYTCTGKLKCQLQILELTVPSFHRWCRLFVIADIPARLSEKILSGIFEEMMSKIPVTKQHDNAKPNWCLILWTYPNQTEDSSLDSSIQTL